VARSSSRNASPSSRSSTSSHGFASGYGGTPVGFPPSSARPASVGFSKSWSSQISATILPCSHRPHSPNRRLQASSSPRSICSTTNCTKPASEAMCQPTLLPPIIVGGGDRRELGGDDLGELQQHAGVAGVDLGQPFMTACVLLALREHQERHFDGH